ncbi:MAG: InlB B-repeat-containing protein [Allobaculum sp.]|uniref:InlB B-repeat-containing protein n=1 Tax=Allobaculum sp. TaxID=1872463 RepID=UPI00399BA202
MGKRQRGRQSNRWRYGTIFDGLKNSYMVFDLGEEKTIAGIGYCPRTNAGNNNYAARTQYGVIAGSNDKETWTDLYTIPEVPAQNKITQVRASSFNEGVSTSYRYIKYYKNERGTNPDADYVNIAEFEVYGEGTDYVLSDLCGLKGNVSALPQSVIAGGVERNVTWQIPDLDGRIPFSVIDVTGTVEAAEGLPEGAITAKAWLYPADLEYLINGNAAENDPLWTLAKKLDPGLLNTEAADQGWEEGKSWGVIGEKTTGTAASDGDYGITGSNSSLSPYDYGWWAGTKNEDSQNLKIKLTLPAGKHTIQVGTHGYWWNSDSRRGQKAYWRLEDGTEYELGDCSSTEENAQAFRYEIDLNTDQTGTLVFKKTGEKEPTIAWVTVSGKYDGLDRSTLNTFYDHVKDYESAQYSAPSWEGFPDALAAAAEALKTPLPTEEAVSEALTNLQREAAELKRLFTLTFKNGNEIFYTVENAVEGGPLSSYIPAEIPTGPEGSVFIGWGIQDGDVLSGSRLEFTAQFKGDTTNLAKLVSDNENKLGTDDQIPDIYTDESYTAFKTAMDAAKAITEKELPTVDEVKSAEEALTTAVAGLKDAVIFTFKTTEEDASPVKVKVEKDSAQSVWENKVPSFTREGFVFTGWDAELPQTAMASTTFIAQWKSALVSPVAYFPFNGNPNDHVGNWDGVSIAEDGIRYDDEGKNGQSIHIDPNKGLKFENTFGIDDDSDWTISFWAKSDLEYSTSTSDLRTYSIMQDQTESTELALRLGQTRAGFGIRVNPESGGVLSLSQEPFLNKDAWNHFTYVHDETAGQVKVYVDGVQKGVTLDDERTGWKIHFPGYYLGKSDFQGSVDELRIFNRALTPEQITDVFNDPQQTTKMYTITFKYGNDVLASDEYAKATSASEIQAAAEKALEDNNITAEAGTIASWNKEFADIDANEEYVLTFVADKTDLQKAYDDYSLLSNADRAWTDASFAALTSALTSAKAILDKADASVAEVGDTLSALNSAHAGLKEAVKVTFDSKDGSAVGPVYAPKGEVFEAPENPTRSGFEFAGWFKDEAFETQFVFGTDTVEEETTLYAKWVATDKAPLGKALDLAADVLKRNLMSAADHEALNTSITANQEVYEAVDSTVEQINAAVQAVLNVLQDKDATGVAITGVSGIASKSTKNSTTEGRNSRIEETLDNDPQSYYHSDDSTSELVAKDRNLFYDLGESKDLFAISFLPRQYTSPINGDLFNVEVYAGESEEEMTCVGTYAFDHAVDGNEAYFSNETRDQYRNMYFTPVHARYVNLVIKATGGKSQPVNTTATVAEVKFFSPSDKTDLNASIEAAKAKSEDAYTAASWKAMQDALAKAEAAAANPAAYQTGDNSVDAAKAALDTAVEGLVEKVTVTFDVDGTATSQTIDPGTPVDKPADPEKTGYTFDGWYAPEADTAFDFTTKIDTSVTLTARWTINSYTVTMNADNGSEATTVKADYNTKITAPTEPTKTGCTFAGWFAEDSETAFDFNTPITADLTLTAHWTINTYTVTMNADNGSEATTVKAEYNTKITAPTAPTKTGYTFTGWFAAGSDTAFDFNTLITADLTLTAHWTINSYTVTFESNGGSDVAAVSANYHTTIEAPTAPTKNGYTFAGWFKDEALTQTFNFASDKITESTTLYAKWEAPVEEKVTITFNTGKGNPIDSVQIKKGETYTPPANATHPTEGYRLVGWFTDASCWDRYVPGPVNSDLTLYAKWSNIYTIKFNTGAPDTTVARPVRYNEKVTVPTVTAPEGKVLEGWYTDKEYTQKFDLDAPVTADHELHAKWVDEEKITVTFNTGKGNPIDPVQIKKGDTYTPPANATHPTEGYRLVGWFTDASCWDRYVPGPVNSDLTLYAKWSNIYTIKFNTGDPNTTVARPVRYNEKVTIPTVTAPEGKVLEGWYTDENYTQKFDLDAPVTANHELHAKWVDANPEEQLDKTLIMMATDKAASILNALTSFHNESAKTTFAEKKTEADSAKSSATTQKGLDDPAKALNDAMLKLRKAPSKDTLDTLKSSK